MFGISKTLTAPRARLTLHSKKIPFPKFWFTIEFTRPSLRATLTFYEEL
jgi:hypothetical protein